MRRTLVLAGVLIASLLVPLGQPLPTAEAQAGCTFTLGFKALRDQIPDIVGECLENERFNLENGNAEQRTSGGLLVWRKADNWTAFTDGSTTWINGPEGLASRPNEGPLFPWESAAPAAAAPPAAPPAAPAPTPAPPPPAVPAPPADPWIGDIMFGYDASGAGAIPSGGSLPDKADGTVYAFFSWRNIPGGSKIGLRILYGRETSWEGDFTPTNPQGRTRLTIISYQSSGGGAQFEFGDVGLVISLNGREMARGSVAL